MSHSDSFASSHRQRVEIDPVDAGLHHPALPVGEVGLLGGFAFRQDAVIDQEARDVFGGLHQKVPAAHRRVEHVDGEHRLHDIGVAAFPAHRIPQHPAPPSARR